MAERERAAAPPYGGVFIPRKQVMDADDLQRAIWRIGHEIVERNHGVTDVVLVGLQTGGMPIAHRLAEALQAVTEEAVPVGSLDVVESRHDRLDRTAPAARCRGRSRRGPRARGAAAT